MKYLNQLKTTHCTHFTAFAPQQQFTTSHLPVPPPPAAVDVLGASHPLLPQLPLIITACGRGGRLTYTIINTKNSNETHLDDTLKAPPPTARASAADPPLPLMAPDAAGKGI